MEPHLGGRAEPRNSGKRPKSMDRDPVDDEEEELRRKRSRGRPRLDTKDESAADRRRTQIRLAQRAYRHRKDTAIATLEQKVKDLEEANKEISQEFTAFYDLISAEGLLESVPQASQHLKAVATRLIRLAQPPTERSDGMHSPSTGQTYTPQCTDQTTVDSGPGSCYGSRSDQGGASPFLHLNSVEIKPDSSSNYLGSLPKPGLLNTRPFEVVTQPTPDNASFPFYTSMEPRSHNTHICNSASSSLYSALPNPLSYAFQERTFGRRLQRSTLESALKLISMTHPPPERYAAVFGFCLLFEPRDSIIRRLSVGLSRAQNESMSYWKVPFTNLGGAGLHFLDTDCTMLPSSHMSGNTTLPIGNEGMREIDKPKDVTGYSMGPFTPEVELTRDNKLDHRMQMMSQGFEGEFFDSDEVEIYLRQIGIVIPQHAEFVQAEIDVSQLQDIPDPILHATSGPNSELTSDVAFLPKNIASGGMPSHHLDELNGMWTSGLSEPATMRDLPLGDASRADTQHPAILLNYPSADTSSMANNVASTSSSLKPVWAMSSTWTTAEITISVDILINEMVRKSVCLGRTPGIRPQDVKKAIQVAAGLSS